MKLRLGICFALLCLISCQREPQFTPLLRPMYPNELVQHAEYIVIGSIADMKPLGSAREIDGLTQCLLNIKVDHVLRGKLDSNRISIILFAADRPLPGGQAGFLPFPNTRAAFFLRKEKGTFRPATDGYRFTIALPEQGEFQPGVAPNVAIAEVLLMPTRDQGLMPMAVGDVSYLLPVGDAINAIRNALKRRAEPYHFLLCQEFSRDLEGQVQCVRDIASDPASPPQQRAWASEALREMSLTAQKRKLEFASGDIASLRDQSESRILAILQVLSFHEDQSVSRLVCSAVKKNYPSEIWPQCQNAAR